MEEIKKYTEKVEWKDANTANLIMTQELPVKDSKDNTKVTGTQTRVTEAEVTYEDLHEGLQNELKGKNNVMTQVKQMDNKIESIEANLKKEGISKVKTNEMIRVEKALKGIRLIEQLNNTKEQRETLYKQACKGDDFIKAREESLAKRPKDEVEVE